MIRFVASPELVDLCASVGSGVVHHLSLHSKELFHSNMIGWLAERYPVEATRVFADYAEPGSSTGPTVQREHLNLDLVLRLPGCQPMVIENKVWSLPDDTQLLRYSENQLLKLEGPVTAVLLSLTPPMWEGGEAEFGGVRWRHLGYEKLAEGVRAASRRIGQLGAPDDHFAAELLERYAAYVESICRLVQLTRGGDLDDLVALPSDEYELLQALRFHDVVSKLRYQRAIQRSLDRIRQIGLTVEMVGPAEAANNRFADSLKEWRFFRIGGRLAGIEVAFTSGGPLLSGAVELECGDSLWWQYQNKQWRLAVKTLDLRGPTELTRQHDYIAQRYGAWFDFQPAAKVLGAERGRQIPTRGVRTFNKFKEFAYLYCLPDKGSAVLTVGELAELCTRYVERAVRWPA